MKPDPRSHPCANPACSNLSRNKFCSNSCSNTVTKQGKPIGRRGTHYDSCLSWRIPHELVSPHLITETHDLVDQFREAMGWAPWDWSQHPRKCKCEKCQAGKAAYRAHGAGL